MQVKRRYNCNQLERIKSLNWQGDSKNGEKGTHTGGTTKLKECLDERDKKESKHYGFGSGVL